MRKTAVLAALAAVPVLLAVAGPASASSGTARVNHTRTTAAATGAVYTATVLRPVPHNRVQAIGVALVRLRGNQARVQLNVVGLIKAPHAMHIHYKGEGECPEARDAGIHNGHRAMSTADGLGDYGPIGSSLTTRGDTSPSSALAINRFPQTGTFRYARTIRVSWGVAHAIRTGNAVVVVHGIDYNHNGTYDNVLGVSELTPTLPEEATAPALCGALARLF